jgi:adenylate cyclase
MTDAQHYTTLSESMAPEDLSTHLKEYFQYLFREVKTQEGLVCNVIGDSMLALWPAAGPDAALSLKACQASLQITEAVDRFNKKYPTRSLPTRIGLHAGYLLLDNIGAEDHYEYAPVGDIVNTASRIEGLNKHLGTQILASGEALRGVSGIRFREIGLFLLGGKTQPVSIYELFRAKHLSLSCNRLYQEAFPQALNLFRAGEWDTALAAFNHCLTLHTEDGPSYFYKQLCESYLLNPSAADRRGIIQVEK